MEECPEGVTEAQWRAKLVYEAVQVEQTDTTRTDYSGGRPPRRHSRASRAGAAGKIGSAGWYGIAAGLGYGP